MENIENVKVEFNQIYVSDQVHTSEVKSYLLQ